MVAKHGTFLQRMEFSKSECRMYPKSPRGSLDHGAAVANNYSPLPRRARFRLYSMHMAAPLPLHTHVLAAPRKTEAAQATLATAATLATTVSLSAPRNYHYISILYCHLHAQLSTSHALGVTWLCTTRAVSMLLSVCLTLAVWRRVTASSSACVSRKLHATERPDQAPTG